MKRREFAVLFYRRYYIVCNKRGILKFLAAVNDAVPDTVYLVL